MRFQFKLILRPKQDDMFKKEDSSTGGHLTPPGLNSVIAGSTRATTMDL